MPELIDKKAAYEALKHEAEMHELPFTREAYERAARIIDQMYAYTIEAEPVRNGRWENPTESKPRMFERNGHTFTERQCSECGRWSISVTGSIMCKYCPQCGARMGGDGNAAD